MAKILFVSHTAERTGPTQSLLLLVRHLPSEWEKVVLLPCGGSFSDTLADEGVRALTLPSLGRRQLLDVRRLIVQERFDLVYGNNTSGACRNALIAAKSAGVPFVCHVRGIAQKGEWRKFGFLRFADAVVAVSHACARSVSGYVLSKRLHVVHNGVEIPEFRSHDDATNKGSHDRNGSEARIVSVSHIKRRKGQHCAVQAMARISQAVPSAQLQLVGALDRDPGYVTEVRQLIQHYKLEERVSLLGFRPDVRSLVEEARVFVHTATEDPHPRAVLEAMASGIPVVAFDVDGVGETVASGSTGFLVPVGDSEMLAAETIRLLEDRELNARFGLAGRRRAQERFSAQATAQEVRGIIERTLNGSGATTREREGATVP